jgi:hypothetical protein
MYNRGFGFLGVAIARLTFRPDVAARFNIHALAIY